MLGGPEGAAVRGISCPVPAVRLRAGSGRRCGRRRGSLCPSGAAVPVERNRRLRASWSPGQLRGGSRSGLARRETAPAAAGCGRVTVIAEPPGGRGAGGRTGQSADPQLPQRGKNPFRMTEGGRGRMTGELAAAQRLYLELIC